MSTVMLATLIADPFMLFVGGFFITFLIYKYVVDRINRSIARRFFVSLFPLTILGLWILGTLPYLNFVESAAVYCGLMPQWMIGPNNGNDFMWNGLGVHWFGKLVPDALVPTYRYSGFNALAILIGLSYPVILGWGVLEGLAMALIVRPKWHLTLLHWLRVIVIGLFLSLSAAAFTALMVVIYQ